MKTVLVTGCSGFIGSNLVRSLLKDFNVVGIDKKQSLSSNFTYFDFDLCNQNYGFLYDKLEKSGIEVDYVVHLAAFAGVRKSLENPSLYLYNNIISFENVIEFCKNIKPKKLLFASSSSIYGHGQNTPERNFKFDPLSPYAISKCTNEFQAELAREYLKIISMRFFTVYGPNGRRDMSPFIFMDRIFKNKPIDLYGSNAKRDYTYIDDVVEAIKLILLHGKSDAYNIGKGKPDYVKDLIKLIQKKFNKKNKINIKKINSFESKTTKSNSNLLKKELGFKPKTSLKDGIEKTCDWYLKNFACQPRN